MIPGLICKMSWNNIWTDKISQQPENCENRNDPDLVQAFLKKWWVESDFKAPNLPLSLRFKDGNVIWCSSVLMRFLCKTSHKDSCAWPCLIWHCQPIKSTEYNGVCFYDWCSNINCRLSRFKTASNINFAWILTDFP